MSKTQLISIFVIMFRFLFAIALLSTRNREDEKEIYSLMAEAQRTMDKVAND